MSQITFTIDLEDPTARYAPDGRHIAMTRRILDLCDEMRCRATFFVVGKLAQSAPKLIQDIAARGHEIAYHSHAHVPLTQENPARFREQTHADKHGLEQLIGKPVVGYRAPMFSLTPRSLWTVAILAELGFRYSSSVMPTRLSRFGFPNAPTVPFEWPNGMIEFPLPVATLHKNLRVPYLGGIYLYALPGVLTHRWLRQAKPEEVLWTYTHPYDFDSAEPYKPMPNTARGISMALWLARQVAEQKIRDVLKEQLTAPPLNERLTGHQLTRIDLGKSL